MPGKLPDLADWGWEAVDQAIGLIDLENRNKLPPGPASRDEMRRRDTPRALGPKGRGAGQGNFSGKKRSAEGVGGPSQKVPRVSVQEEPEAPVRCFKCGKVGHFSRTCPSRRTDDGAPPADPKGKGRAKVNILPTDNSDRMLHPEIFRELQTMLGWRFTLDAAANVDGSNTLVTKFCSKVSRSFFEEDLDGHTLWMNPPFEDISRWLEHYSSQKHANPRSVRACVIVPSWYKYSLEGKHFLRGWKCLKFFGKGSELFSEPTEKCPWPEHHGACT